MARLSAAQKTLLQNAAERESGSILPLPITLAVPASAPRAIGQLVRRGLAEERQVRANALVWRADNGGRLGVFITAAGCDAVRAPDRPRRRCSTASVECAVLAGLSDACLGSLWQDLFQSPVTPTGRATLVLGIAHRLQQIAMEKLARRHALELASLLQTRTLPEPRRIRPNLAHCRSSFRSLAARYP